MLLLLLPCGLLLLHKLSESFDLVSHQLLLTLFLLLRLTFQLLAEHQLPPFVLISHYRGRLCCLCRDSLGGGKGIQTFQSVKLRTTTLFLLFLLLEIMKDVQIGLVKLAEVAPALSVRTGRFV